MIDQSKVKVVCRIRQSNISETYSSASQQAQTLGSTLRAGESLGEKSSVQQKSILQNATNNGSAATSSVMAANSSLDKDKKICIFTGSSTKEKPFYVAASGNPIKSQLLQDYVKTDKNIIQYRHSILENANIFKFDHAMNPKVNNHQLYKDECDDLVQKAMSQGISSTFVLVGPAKAGKKFTMKGGENAEKGILSRAIDSLIQLSELQSQGAGTKSTKTGNLKPGIKPVVILFSIYAIYNNEVIDLLSSSQNEDTDSEEISEFELTFSGDYRKYYMKSRDRLKSVGSGEQSARRLHVIYKFSIYRNDNSGKKSKISVNSPNRGLISTLTFIHCADFNKTRLPEFTILSDYLVDVATRKDVNLLETPAYQNSKLVTQINDSLNSGQDNYCVLICNVSGAYDYLSSSVDCLQFCAGVKERIDQYFEDINTFNQDHELVDALVNPQQGSNYNIQSLKNSNGQYQVPQSPFKDGSHIASTVQNNTSQLGGSPFKGLNQSNNNPELIHIAYRNNQAQFQRKRGQNPSASEIQKDLSNLMKDIYSFSDQTPGLNQEEINAWAVDREAELQSILQDIGKLSPENQKLFDTTSVKIQESLNFLNQVKKNAIRLSLSRSPSGDLQNGSLNSDDLGTLMSQYNKSKQSFIKGNNPDGELSSVQSPFNQGSTDEYTYDNINQNQTANGKKSLKQLRERIMGKIDEIINENDTSKRTIRVGSSRNGQKDAGDISIEKSNRNLRLLKELLTDESFLAQEKKAKLKAENLELKNQLQEFKSHMGEIEKELQEKLDKVLYLEDSKEQLIQQVERDREIIQLKLEKEEMMERNDEELRNILERLKVKLQRRKEECSMLKANIEKAEINVAEERQIMANERNALIKQAEDSRANEELARLKADNLESVHNRLCYDLEDTENSLKKALSDVQFCEKRLESVQQMLVEEQQLGKELIVKQNMLERQIDEAEDRAQQFEHKLAKQKRKNAEEKSLVAEERDAEHAKRKEATHRLKAEVRELERMQNTMTSEIKSVKQENQRLQIAAQEGQIQMNNLMKQNRELENQLENTRVELKRKRNNQRDIADQVVEADRKLREENEKLQDSLIKVENAMKQVDKQLLEKINEVEQLKRDVIVYDQQATEHKEYINKLNRENRYLLESQPLQERDQEIRQVSDKQSGKSSSKLNDELNDIKRENKYLKDIQVQQSSLVEELKHSAQKQDNKLKKNNLLIDQLTQQLNQFETQINELLKQQQSPEKVTMIQSSGAIQNRFPSPLAAGSSQQQQSTQQPTRSILKKPRFTVTKGLLDEDTDEDQSDY